MPPPPDYSESRRSEVKEQLSRVILRLLAENKALHYYQGLHDIVITFLLVVGEDTTYAIMNTLVNFHIRCVLLSLAWGSTISFITVYIWGLWFMLCHRSITVLLCGCISRDFLDVDMSRTKLVIGYLRPLLALEDAELEHFVTRSAHTSPTYTHSHTSPPHTVTLNTSFFFTSCTA